MMFKKVKTKIRNKNLGYLQLTRKENNKKFLSFKIAFNKTTTIEIKHLQIKNNKIWLRTC